MSVILHKGKGKRGKDEGEEKYKGEGKHGSVWILYEYKYFPPFFPPFRSSGLPAGFPEPCTLEIIYDIEKYFPDSISR